MPVTHSTRVQIAVVPPFTLNMMIAMEQELHDLHIHAGRVCGQEKTCGKKVRYPDEATAAHVCEKFAKSGKMKHALEPYPCDFCGQWHLGRVMTIDELRQWKDIPIDPALP